MILVTYLAARRVVRAFGAAPAAAVLAVGVVALALLAAAELAVLVAFRRQTVAEFAASRDAVSGTVYLGSLALVAAMPLLVRGRAVRDGRH
jgi:predicted membrane-bound spermidine synthase